MSDETEASPDARAERRPRRSAKRVFWGIVLLALGCVLFGIGIDAIFHPAAVVAKSSNTPRSPDSDGEAAIGGILMCFFGLIVLGYGIALLLMRPGGSVFGKAPDQ